MVVNYHKGIVSIGLRIPPLALNVKELAKLQNVDPDKYTIGLGCQAMALYINPCLPAVDCSVQKGRNCKLN